MPTISTQTECVIDVIDALNKEFDTAQNQLIGLEKTIQQIYKKQFLQALRTIEMAGNFNAGLEDIDRLKYVDEDFWHSEFDLHWGCSYYDYLFDNIGGGLNNSILKIWLG